MVKKTNFKRSQHAVWLIPFIAFALGYIATGFFFYKADIYVPNVVGKTLIEASKILSSNHLGLRLIEERHDNALPEGVIFEQVPGPQQRIKSNQHVFVSVATHKPRNSLPDFWGKNREKIRELVSTEDYEIETSDLVSNYPKGICIAQSPSIEQQQAHQKINLYFSAGTCHTVLMPDFKNASINSIQDSLKSNDIRAEIFHIDYQPENHECLDCKVIDQQPAVGSIVDLSRGLHIQLKVLGSGHR